MAKRAVGQSGRKAADRILYCESCGRKTTHYSTFGRTALIVTALTLGFFALAWPFCHYLCTNWVCGRCGRARNLLRTSKRPY